MSDQVRQLVARVEALAEGLERDRRESDKVLLYVQQIRRLATDLAIAFPEPCGCSATCGDDGDIDGPGTCKGLPRG